MTPDHAAPTIRCADADDADALSVLASACFVETFGHLYPDADLRGFLRSAYSSDAWRTLLRDPRYRTWLLEDGGRALGYALAGPCGLPHADVAAGDGELKRLYVLREAQNGGYGGRLCDAALAWLDGAAPRTLWIGVWSENFGAQRFYGRHGFERVGEYEFAVGDVRDREFILRRAPASAARP